MTQQQLDRQVKEWLYGELGQPETADEIAVILDLFCIMNSDPLNNFQPCYTTDYYHIGN
jgi:hypothetical protein